MPRHLRHRVDADTADAARRRLEDLRPAPAAMPASEDLVPPDDLPTAGGDTGTWLDELMRAAPTGRTDGTTVALPSEADTPAEPLPAPRGLPSRSRSRSGRSPRRQPERTDVVERIRVGSHRWPGLPAEVAGARWDVSPRAVLGLVLVAALSLAVAGGWTWRARAQGSVDAPAATVPAVAGTPRATPPGDGPTAAASDSASAPAAVDSAPAGAAPAGAAPAGAAADVQSAAPLTVHVVGKVRRAGVVELAPGARVLDAVEAAGGATGADLSLLNLARLVVDGEQIVVPAPGDPPPPEPPPGATPGAATGSAPGSPGSGTAGGVPAGGPVDLNSATVAQLDEALPGVGPVLAQRIVDWREANGGFRSVDELQDVSGIGAATFADLQPLVRV